MSAFERLLEQKAVALQYSPEKDSAPGDRCFRNGIYGRKDHRSSQKVRSSCL